ncbi:uncharacterized protein V1516DRAFT_621741 [Lipomyces oligophaga]|uniref:uncharacterized protein n=1 Tax=Lipomyces oligophaga TaxID=45792 RepID=UPI0034CEE74F
MISSAFSVATSSNLARLSKTVAATSSALVAGGNSASYGGDIINSAQYRALMGEMAPTLRKPGLQSRMFAFTSSNRSAPKHVASDRSHSVLGAANGNGPVITGDMLQDLPESDIPFSLMDGFKATLPDPNADGSDSPGKNQIASDKNDESKLKNQASEPEKELTGIELLEHQKKDIERKLCRIAIRKAMVQQSNREINDRITQLIALRDKNDERLTKYGDQQTDLEEKSQVIDYRIELLREDEEDQSAEQVNAQDVDPSVDSFKGGYEVEFNGNVEAGSSDHEYSNLAVYDDSDDTGSVLGDYQAILMGDNGENYARAFESAFAPVGGEMADPMRGAWVSSILEWESLRE